MNRYKKLIAFLVCCISVAPFIYTYSDFLDEIDNMFKRQQQRMRKRIKKVGDTFKNTPDKENSAHMNVAVDQKDGNVVVSVNPLQADEKTFNAEFNNNANSLTISTSAGILKLISRENYLSVELSYEQRKETKKQNGKSLYMSSGTSQIGKTLGGRVQLANTQINYDPKTKTLAIIVPLEKEKNKQKQIMKIPINVK